MSDPSSPYYILDPHWDFLLTLKSEPLARTYAPIVSTELPAALVEFSKPGSSFGALFVNPAIDSAHGMSLIRMAIKQHPSMPIFYLTAPDFPILPDSELKALTVRDVLLKPLRFNQLVKVVQEAQLAFDPADLLKRVANQDKLDQEAQAGDADFLPISATKFVSGSSCFFDVYVRLKADRYIKILQAGDAFTPDRVKLYLGKGVEFFFLRREAQEGYLRYCDKLTAQVLKMEGLSPRAKLSVAGNEGAEVLSFFRNQGIDEAAIGHAVKFFDNVKQLAQQLKSDKIASFLADAAAMEHGAGLTLISSFMLKPLGFTTDKSIHLVGLASLLHDIGLQGMDPKLADECEDRLNPEERELFRTHPDKGVAALSGIQGVDPAVLQAVWQHHERKTRDGFPQRLGAGVTNRLAEIVGISDEYLSMMRDLKAGKTVNQKIWMESRIVRGFSSVVVEAFRTAFKL